MVMVSLFFSLDTCSRLSAFNCTFDPSSKCNHNYPSHVDLSFFDIPHRTISFLAARLICVALCRPQERKSLFKLAYITATIRTASFRAQLHHDKYLFDLEAMFLESLHLIAHSSYSLIYSRSQHRF